MFRCYPHNILEEEVIAINRKHKEAIEEYCSISLNTIEESPIIFRPHIWLEFLKEYLYFVVTWVLFISTFILGIDPV